MQKYKSDLEENKNCAQAELLQLDVIKSGREEKHCFQVGSGGAPLQS